MSFEIMTTDQIRKLLTQDSDKKDALVKLRHAEYQTITRDGALPTSHQRILDVDDFSRCLQRAHCRCDNTYVDNTLDGQLHFYFPLRYLVSVQMIMGIELDENLDYYLVLSLIHI